MPSKEIRTGSTIRKKIIKYIYVKDWENLERLEWLKEDKLQKSLKLKQLKVVKIQRKGNTLEWEKNGFKKDWKSLNSELSERRRNCKKRNAQIAYYTSKIMWMGNWKDVTA